ncbi:aromatic-amino-acid aminotransferase [Enterobacter asburiae]|uniref:Aromatic-amino-acid aminotransferase n=1 Tax=Enterobacter asburiae TaxID=61645 RepID=A0A376FIV6_ENTAS|nr:aromatic-amino-acid aminotransferase [Enterobacter asburiae]
MFQKVDAYAGDPILSLMERFKEDPRSDKVNLSIGLYYNHEGFIPQLQAVAEAEARLNAVPHGASLYLPMEGLNAYRSTIAPLLFWCRSPGARAKARGDHPDAGRFGCAESGCRLPEKILSGFRRVGQ